MGNIVSQVRDVDVGGYYPNTVAPAKEFRVISEVENPELKKIWAIMWKVFMNTFVYDLDEEGAKRWEQMLKLYPIKTDTLESRRKAILAKINSSLPYTERSLQQMLDGVYGTGKIKVNLDYNRYALWLDVAAEMVLKSLAIRQYARVISPANLSLNVSNTITFELGLFYGGLIKQTKHVSIYPNGDFTVEMQDSSCVATGVVRQVKYIVIRS